MPAAVVVDASAVLAVGFAEPTGGEVVRRLRGAAMHAPRLLELELANAVVMRCRRDPERAPLSIASLQRMLAMNIVLHDVDPLGVLAVALEHGLTAYDAAYLRLARTLGYRLVTLDRRLAAADEASDQG